jgi:Rps23 Pro-64 3,4-dihydroxylase Tpa1-like proline 4-hydroxylase
MQDAAHNSTPFDHWVIDDFFDTATAVQLASDFYEYDDPRWLTRHSNELEDKRISTHWDGYPKSIYAAFFYLCSQKFINQLETLTGIEGLVSDYGLHGGGMHIHSGTTGKLNLHQDAELHPKLGLKRKLNIVIYLNPHWQPTWGGNLQLWSADESGSPGELVKEIEPSFNRAIIFDTTQNSWHGLPEKLSATRGQNRKSIALFYYIKDDSTVEGHRTRAMFAPSKDQQDDPAILDAIRERLSVPPVYGEGGGQTQWSSLE